MIRHLFNVGSLMQGLWVLHEPRLRGIGLGMKVSERTLLYIQHLRIVDLPGILQHRIVSSPERDISI